MMAGSCVVINEGDFVRNYEDKDDERIWMVVAMDETLLPGEDNSNTNKGTCVLMEMEELHQDEDGEYVYGAIGGKSAAVFTAPCVDYEEIEDNPPENIWWDSIPDVHLDAAGYEEQLPDPTPTPTETLMTLPGFSPTPTEPPAELRSTGVQALRLAMDHMSAEYPGDPPYFPFELATTLRPTEQGLALSWGAAFFREGERVHCDIRKLEVSCGEPRPYREYDVGGDISPAAADTDEMLLQVRGGDARWAALLDDPAKTINLILLFDYGRDQPVWHGGLNITRTTGGQFIWNTEDRKLRDWFDE